MHDGNHYVKKISLTSRVKVSEKEVAASVTRTWYDNKWFNMVNQN